MQSQAHDILQLLLTFIYDFECASILKLYILKLCASLVALRRIQQGLPSIAILQSYLNEDNINAKYSGLQAYFQPLFRNCIPTVLSYSNS
jgi:hypothetical protein